MKAHLVDRFSEDLRCTIRDCLDCGCLVPGGPTRCKRCAKDAESLPRPGAPERPAEKCPTCGVLRGSPASQKQCADAWHRSAEVARPSSGGGPDPLPEVLPNGTRTLDMYRLWGEARLDDGAYYGEWVRPKSRRRGAVLPDNIDWSSLPNPPAAPLTGNDGTGWQQAGREELHFCDYTTGPHICEGDACNGHTVKEMRAYDAGRASLEKRIEAHERCIAWFEENNWRLDGAEKDRLLQLRRELGKGA